MAASLGRTKKTWMKTNVYWPAKKERSLAVRSVVSYVTRSPHVPFDLAGKVGYIVNMVVDFTQLTCCRIHHST